MRTSGQCRPNCSVFEDLNPIEQMAYNLLMKTTKSLYKNNWKYVIDKNKRYPNTNFVNLDKIDGD